MPFSPGMKYHLVAGRLTGRTKPVRSQLFWPHQSQSLLKILCWAISTGLREPPSNTVTVLLKGFPHIVTVPSISSHSRWMPSPKFPCAIHQSLHAPIFLSSNKELRGGRRRIYLLHCARCSTPRDKGIDHIVQGLCLFSTSSKYICRVSRGLSCGGIKRGLFCSACVPP